jgi:hypothetical protein
MKKQTDFSFDEAKMAAIHHLSELASFMENMHYEFHNQVPLDWAITLRTLEMKVSQASNPCLQEYDIRQIWDLAQHLIQAHPDVTHQLTQLWNLYAEVFNILRSNPNNTGYAPRGIIIDNWTRIKNADLLAENLVSEVRNNPSTFAFPVAFLLLHLVRVETIGFSIWKQLSDVAEKFGLTGKYDIELICSVQNTVVKYNKEKKQNELRSDVKAIRDSIAHGHFLIRKIADEYEIEFNNNEKGYQFHKLFSKKEFQKFFDLYTILYKFQFTLLIIIELLPILTTHLFKQPSAS